MSVHNQFERSLRYVCDMFIKYEVSKIRRPDRPSATACLAFAMGATSITKVDIGHIAYKKLRKRAKKKLDQLPGKGTGAKKARLAIEKRVAAMKKKALANEKKAEAKEKKKKAKAKAGKLAP